MKNKLLLLSSHIFVLIVGFGLGVYFLPILTAPKSQIHLRLMSMNKRRYIKQSLSKI